MSSGHQTLALPVELLSVTVAKVSGVPKILLTLRLDVECFESTNLALCQWALKTSQSEALQNQPF
jgi:hypothetical protein